MTSSFVRALRLTAFVCLRRACVRACAQARSISSTASLAGAARRRSGRDGGRRQTKPPSWWCASTGSRRSFGRRTAGSRNWRTPSIGSRISCRSSARMSNSASASAPARRAAGAGRRRSAASAAEAVIEGSAAAKPKKSDAFDPDADAERAGRAATARNDGAERAARPSRRPPPGPRSNSARAAPAAPPPAATGPLITGSGVAMLDAPREQFNAALQAFQAGQYPAGRGRVQGVPGRQHRCIA